MRPADLHFFPLAWLFVLGLLLLRGLLIALIEMGLLEYAYAKIGVNRRDLFEEGATRLRLVKSLR